MSTESTSQLVDLIFMTLYIYDDRGSRKAVDDLIVKSLNEVTFMKTFAANLVQTMDKQLKVQSHVGCYRLMKWSCLLLCKSQFISVSKNAFSRVAAAQALTLQVSLQASSHERRACRRTFIHSFLEVCYLNKVLSMHVYRIICLLLIFFFGLLPYISHPPFSVCTWRN